MGLVPFWEEQEITQLFWNNWSNWSTKARVTKLHANIWPFNTIFWMPNDGWSRLKSFCSSKLKSNTILILDSVIIMFKVIDSVWFPRPKPTTFSFTSSFWLLFIPDHSRPQNGRVWKEVGAQLTQFFVLQMKTLRSWAHEVNFSQWPEPRSATS